MPVYDNNAYQLLAIPLWDSILFKNDHE